MAIACSSRRYKVMVAYAGTLVFVYPIGAPAIVFIMLWRHRDRLYPQYLRTGVAARATLLVNVGSPEHRAIRERVGLRDQAPITAFAELYRPRYWYWEPFNMIRRLAL